MNVRFVEWLEKKTPFHFFLFKPNFLGTLQFYLNQRRR